MSRGAGRRAPGGCGLRALIDEAIVPITHYASGDPRIGEQMTHLAAHLHAAAPRTGDREVLAAFLDRLRTAGGA